MRFLESEIQGFGLETPETLRPWVRHWSAEAERLGGLAAEQKRDDPGPDYRLGAEIAHGQAKKLEAILSERNGLDIDYLANKLANAQQLRKGNRRAA